MKAAITSKGKTVMVPDDCTGPRNRRPKFRPNIRPFYTAPTIPYVKSRALDQYGRIVPRRERRKWELEAKRAHEAAMREQRRLAREQEAVTVEAAAVLA